MSVLRKHVFARSVVLRQLPPSLDVEQALSCFPHGRFHDIIPRSKDVLAIKFLDSRSATQFTQKFLLSPRAPPLKDATIEYDQTSPLPVDILTAIGLRNASRVIRVSSNNVKDIPEDFIDELRKCGSIESVESDKRKAVIHFMSIDAAMKALDMLRTNKTYAGYSVYYGFDQKCDTPLPYPASSRTDLVLTGLPKGTTTSELLRRIQSGLPDLNREVVRSVVYDESNAKAFINFLEPAVAKIVFDSFNNAESSTGGVSVSWCRNASNPVSASLRMAVSAGASRTLTVSHLENVQQLRRVLKAARKLGTVLNHPYDPSNIKTVNIEFADIFSAFKAIERIGKNMDSYPEFANTFISFATSTNKLKPLKIVRVQTISTPELQKGTEATQTQAAPNPSSSTTEVS
ncbi:hypothetical protein DFJ43DRAFT_1156981 [Lentinula guzmanii]|uniref:RRM domain-containing protein n=1 Tax=Lentinula guzmanii TaxID=2804957 RepID=A0AA38JJ79_9AGAR|nr:hypothetical protein DFJ43DRAFT_1156981 [Lentinula guzmanii]